LPGQGPKVHGSRDGKGEVTTTRFGYLRTKAKTNGGLVTFRFRFGSFLLPI